MKVLKSLKILELREMFGLLLIMYDLIWLPMQVFEPPEAQFFFIMGLGSSLYWTTVALFKHFQCKFT